jgi:amino acid permease
MKNFRIIENNNNYYVQYQFMGAWFYARGNLSGYEFEYDDYTNYYTWLFILLPIIFIPFLQIENDIIQNIAIVLFSVSSLLSIITTIFVIISKKKKFYSKDSVIKWIKNLEDYEKKKKEKKEKKKKPVNKLVGVYYNGEVIDGERLERWKKLGKIVGDNDKMIKK